MCVKAYEKTETITEEHTGGLKEKLSMSEA